MEEHRTWPCGSDGREVPRPFCSSFCMKKNHASRKPREEIASFRKPRRVKEEEIEAEAPGFGALPYDILRRIAGSFNIPTLYAASEVCRGWREGLAPLREAMVLVQWGKKFKHGHDGVSRNIDKALDSFLKGAARGCAAAMVDAGLLLWELGRKEEGIELYKSAAELGDPAGQCNLGLSYLQGNPATPQEAVKWFYRAASAGNVRAQYSLALCLQQGRGVERSPTKAARWYLKAAEGGSTRAMYNIALCYSSGEGVVHSTQQARKWMKRAALTGHRKAQYEHGLTLFLDGDGVNALTYLELATRGGEAAASRIRDVLLQQLSPKSKEFAIRCADKWQNRHASR
eukprot:TRINITY_DN3574_c0_g1_i1.p1 TRINITY_DN3574_c0_g1~~TRINITY_DN3574_c0_g1_i1.p1  ORF type:complete len:343 (-),score=77.19 TRINITY_DN3574_c0_g1_i1:191-1219(-)